ncbi:MAG: GTP 3',8-cyclase MoaA [Candidatus Geothermincolia bacterium]
MTETARQEQQVIDYLRISITDRCNLRCVYCMPAEGVKSLAHQDVLSYEELDTFTRAAAAAGIRRVRITGGEPLVRKGAVDFVRMLSAIDPRLKISLTTNGVLLGRYASELKEAGLSRVNISMDTLDPERYRNITRIGNLTEALAGLDAAIDAGLDPVKINVVVLKGLNDDPRPFAELARDRPVHVRFIEYMPYFDDPGKWYVPGDVIKARLAEVGRIEEVESPEGWGPASYFKLNGSEGTLGLISPVSCHFCPSCNRLRVTADGHMRTCLFDTSGFDMKSEMRAGADPDRLREIIEGELNRKRHEGDHHKPKPGSRLRAGDHMSRIGG